MPEDGLYPIVTHAFNFVGRGALGLFQAGDVEMPLGAIQPAAYRLSPWMAAKAARLFPTLIVSRPDGSRIESMIGAGSTAEALAINPAALVVRFRTRVPGTPSTSRSSSLALTRSARARARCTLAR